MPQRYLGVVGEQGGQEEEQEQEEEEQEEEEQEQGPEELQVLQRELLGLR